uniref:GT23 domain-containing protein n=1 Tax=Timema monikensis TaxID=170555 RepID=A0A7R9EFT8_9NEOP|nr:unnamed protein product [Timema monikensis]
MVFGWEGLVHVRRTDKVGTEAAFHQLEEYMLAVDEYFDQLEMKSGPVDQRRIFLASDDPKVLAEAKTKPCWDCVMSLPFTLIGLCSGRAGTVSCRVVSLPFTLIGLCSGRAGTVSCRYHSH